MITTCLVAKENSMLNPVSIHCIYFKYVVQLNLPVSHVAPVYPVPVQSQVKLPGGVLSQVPPFEHGVPVAHSSISAIKKKISNDQLVQSEPNPHPRKHSESN